MCCFSLPIEHVSNTSIFVRGNGPDQYLVYSMKYGSSSEVAMILPIPVPPNSAEDSVQFINLQSYPVFFDDVQSGFPVQKMITASGGFRLPSLSLPKLKVHRVGNFEASFVPSLPEFDRLDERFRIPSDVWDQLPDYSDYGFAVFQLKDTHTRGLWKTIRGALGDGQDQNHTAHPMAFRFPRRNPDLLFFPTVHVHDRRVDEYARYDHTLYCQAGPDMNEYLSDWIRSEEPASDFIDVDRTKGIVDSNQPVWKLQVSGRWKNRDTLVGREGTSPIRS